MRGVGGGVKMVKTETIMEPHKKRIYYCNSCGDMIVTDAELKTKCCEELRMVYRYRNFSGGIWGEFDKSYHLCCCCYEALLKYLDKRSNDKKGLKNVLK